MLFGMLMDKWLTSWDRIFTMIYGVRRQVHDSDRITFLNKYLSALSCTSDEGAEGGDFAY